jgi:hypothetical protein
MKRPGRLQSAQAWMRTYHGKNIVHGYAKHYGVSKLCAAFELRMIGVAVEETCIEQLKTAEQALVKQRQIARQKKQTHTEIDLWQDSDDTFAYIAGYTPGGFAYGTTWEELYEAPPGSRTEMNSGPEFSYGSNSYAGLAGEARGKKTEACPKSRLRRI